MTLIITHSSVPLFGYCWQYQLNDRCVTGNQRSRWRCLVTVWLTASPYRGFALLVVYHSFPVVFGAAQALQPPASIKRRGEPACSMRSVDAICRWPANRSISRRMPLPRPTPSTPSSAGITRRVGDGGGVTRRSNERGQVIAYVYIQEVFWGFRSNFQKSHARRSQVLPRRLGSINGHTQHSQLPTVTVANYPLMST